MLVIDRGDGVCSLSAVCPYDCLSVCLSVCRLVNDFADQSIVELVHQSYSAISQ